MESSSDPLSISIKYEDGANGDTGAGAAVRFNSGL